jgi:hypothetical protein
MYPERVTLTDPRFGLALDTDFSEDFNYASWNVNTELLLTNVPFNSDYRDIVQMDSLDAFNTWLESKPNWKYTNASMQKFNEGIVKIDLPINEAMKYNYLRARNGTSPVTNVQRDYFYFITGIRYGAPNTTYVSIQLDVITTFLYEVDFGQCYVEAGHIGIANEFQFSEYGREYLTVPESHDIGNEYRVIHTEFESVANTLAESANTPIGQGYDILVCSTLDLTQDPGSVTDPHLNSARGAYFQGIPSGAEFYIFPTSDDLLNFFRQYSNKPWITQGIISITIIPNIQRYLPGYDYGTNLSTYPLFKFYAFNAQNIPSRDVAMANGWRDAAYISDVLGPYSILKKFLTYPYLLIELTTWTGSPLVIKPEAWQDANANMREMIALMPPSQRIAIMPNRYNADAETLTSSQTNQADGFDDNAESLDFSVTLDNFVQVPVVNNSYIGFLASNKNGIAFSYSSAQWTEQRALAGAGASYDVQNAQIGNMGRQSAIGNQQQTDASNLMATTGMNNAMIGALTGGIGGGMDDAARGVDPLIALGGAAMGVATTAMTAGATANAQMQAAQIANQARSNSAISDIQTAGSVRDTNNAFATMAAKGDYKNAIAGVQARVQDAKMLQPSVSGQFNGDAFNLINGKFGYSLRFKMINKNALKTIGNFWLRYGYAVNQFIQMPSSLHCMSKFTYWKLSQTYISQGAFPEGFKQVIRGVFEKGVTVWKNPDDIGTTSLFDNTPLTGITY